MKLMIRCDGVAEQRSAQALLPLVRQILRAVSDVHSPQHPFSIHNVIEVGPQFGIHPGEWFGPYSISLALK